MVDSHWLCDKAPTFRSYKKQAQIITAPPPCLKDGIRFLCWHTVLCVGSELWSNISALVLSVQKAFFQNSGDLFNGNFENVIHAAIFFSEGRDPQDYIERYESILFFIWLYMYPMLSCLVRKKKKLSIKLIECYIRFWEYSEEEWHHQNRSNCKHTVK